MAFLEAPAFSYSSDGRRCQYGGVSTPTRVYGGRSADQRRSERRRRLIDAALDIWGDQGWAAVTMRGVCATAGLTDRYFYENFADRDALLVAVWDQTLTDVLAGVVQAMAQAPPEPRPQVRAALDAFVHTVAEDPRKARIGFGAHAGSPALEQRRHDAIQTFARLMVEKAHDWRRVGEIDEIALHVNALIAVGGLAELVSNWLAGSLPIDADQLIEHATNAAVPLVAADSIPPLAAAPVQRSISPRRGR
jgi:AcrR family transcriptional regulator